MKAARTPIKKLKAENGALVAVDSTGFEDMEIETHHTLICIGIVANLDTALVKQQPGVDLYQVSGTDLGNQIDMALLDQLHCQRTVVFVGGEVAKREAKAYGVKWIEDTPAVNDALLQFWRDAVPELDSP